MAEKKTTVDVLREARALISTPEHWTTGELCDTKGRKCAVGAIVVVLFGEEAAMRDEYDRLSDPLATSAIDAINAAIPANHEADNDDHIDRIISFNDGWNIEDRREHHAKVLALFDKAIAEASA